jgi:hypothetical protein
VRPEKCGLSQITIFRRVYFLLPPSRVRTGTFEVARTSVPETPIDKYAELAARKNNVRFTFQTWNWAVVLAESQPGLLKQAAQVAFRVKLVASICLHHFSHRFR